MSHFLFLWSVFEFRGHKKYFLLSTFLIFAIVFIFSKPFFVTLLVETLIIFLIFNQKPSLEVDLELITDEILLNLNTGASFQAVLREILQKNSNFEKIYLKPEHSLEKEIVEVLQYCSEHPSLAYKALKTYNIKSKTLKKLKLKQKSITLQPKAQAIVSLVLYLMIFFFQWHYHPLFEASFRHTTGRLLFLLSILLLLTGLYLVFKTSQFKNEDQI